MPRYFDKNGDNKIDFEEFCAGLQKMKYQGDVVELWTDLDSVRWPVKVELEGLRRHRLATPGSETAVLLLSVS